MKFVLFILLMAFQTSAFAQDLSLNCYYRFTGETLNLLNPMRTNGCHADLIWGKENVCFTGDANALVELMNRGDLDRISSGLLIRDAYQVNADQIAFLGIDQQVFWQTNSTISRCQ